MEHKPIGRRPMARIAVIHHGTSRRGIGNDSKRGLRFQSIALGIVKFRAVDIQSTGNSAVRFGSRCFFLAKKKRHRSRVDESRSTVLFDGFYLGRFR